MRFTAAYYLFLLYLTIMLKPLLPVVNDSIAHFFAEAKHIAVVHAKYGVHHASVEMASNAADDNSKKQSGTKAEEAFPVHVAINGLVYHIAQYFNLTQYFSAFKYPLAANFLAGNYPPPKLAI